jgi:hypothetical protein
MKLPDGSYVIPTPQRIDRFLPFAIQGSVALSDPCTYNEEQFMINGDYIRSSKMRWDERFFFANSQQSVTLPYTYLGGQGGPGFPLNSTDRFRNFSLANDYTITNNLLNQALVAYHRQYVDVVQEALFRYSDIGVSAPAIDNALPQIDIAGALTLGGNGQTLSFAQNTYVVQDNMSWVKNRHTLRFGGGLTRVQDNFPKAEIFAGMIFLSFPDFLLGQSAAQNGTL